MSNEEKQQLIAFFKTFVTEQRFEKMMHVLSLRTEYITVVLEDIYQPHNASAVLRSCDAFGIQDVHIIENRNKYRINPGVALGSSQWLTLHRYDRDESNTMEAMESLKEKGYRIIATTPYSTNVSLEKFNLEEGKTALLFGTEMYGLSETALSHADVYMQIPMYGFVESFNISVSCAISIHHLTYRLRNSSIKWQIDEDRRIDILLDWFRRSIKRSEVYEKIFYEQTGIK